MVIKKSSILSTITTSKSKNKVLPLNPPKSFLNTVSLRHPRSGASAKLTGKSNSDNG
ncbi:hypothetical protein BAZSYMB_SCAFFOLD00101_6 [Bathymodiolus azoricus thioautotrophic gill symbiont]|uniref:Uncharacterized protein n=1 Tax=Bathymodiolus azoricus thioautotrophic gill symbiont TaxID=235205 RepID=A0A1H6M4U7_9GAMM|nr:hypothetical protein BAZSYMB_SCAFFOLD00101_6 [Bathymodiolus azoricus thioautotrophic gill symbiont]